MSGGAADVPRTLRAGRVFLTVVAALVPAGRRSSWREEWEGELWELWRRTGRVPRRYGSGHLAILRYLAGAPRSALWEWKEEWVTDLWQDVRYGVRTLRRAPGFLFVAVATLALGIGANTTVFSLVNGLLVREPPGISEPDRLVRLGRGHAEAGEFDNWSLPVFRDFRERGDWFSGVAGFGSTGSLIVGRGAEAQALPGQVASDGYFQVLGVRMAAGRGFLPEETGAPGAGPVAVISHRLWQTRFSGDPDILERTLVVNGRDLGIVGVTPAGFGGSDVFQAPADVWIPTSMLSLARGPGVAERVWDSRGSSWFWVFARMESGVGFEQAREATESLYARLDRENPELAGQGVRITPGVGMTPEDRADASALVGLLGAIVGLVLLIACANLAGLTLARGAGREGEIGVRTALGASRTRIVRQMLTESLLVALAAGGVAVGLTYLVAGRLADLLPYAVSVGFRPDGRVLLFALAVALATAIFFGLFPALRGARADVRTVLAGGGRTSTSPGTRLRRGLVALQLALSFVLLAGTGALLRSVYNARMVDPGFAADEVAVVGVDPAMGTGYEEEIAPAFYRALTDRAAELPGIRGVGLTGTLPVVDFHTNHTPVPRGADFRVLYRDRPPPAPVLLGSADGGYFEAAGIELLEGRTFRPEDAGEGAEQVAIVNQALVERFFEGEASPVGRELPFGARPDPQRPTRVVGVVRDHRNRGLRADPAAQYWIPFSPDQAGGAVLVARTEEDPAVVAARLEALVEDVDPGVPVLRAADLRSLVVGTLGETRTVSILIAVFGMVALSLAGVGLYGVMSYTVARRTREMGLRMALGARVSGVVGLVLRQGLLVASLGLILGLGLAMAGLRLLRSAVFGVEPADPASLAAGAAVLVVVATLASLVPAWRAARVEPLTALREEG